MKKHLFLATAVLAAPLLAHADLKAMDDGALSDVTGQAGISISGTFQGSVGAVTTPIPTPTAAPCGWRTSACRR